MLGRSILHPCWMPTRCPGRQQVLNTCLSSCSRARSWSCSLAPRKCRYDYTYNSALQSSALPEYRRKGSQFSQAEVTSMNLESAPVKVIGLSHMKFFSPSGKSLTTPCCHLHFYRCKACPLQTELRNRGMSAHTKAQLRWSPPWAQTSPGSLPLRSGGSGTSRSLWRSWTSS